MDLRHRIRIFSAILHWITSYQSIPATAFCNKKPQEVFLALCDENKQLTVFAMEQITA